FHANESYLAAHLLQTLARVQHRAVLDGGSDNVIALAHQAKDARVVTFRASAGEDHLRRTAMHQRCHRCSRLFHRRARMLPVMVYGRGISKPLQIERLHRIKHLRENRRGGVVVKVNATHAYILPLKPQRARSTTKQKSLSLRVPLCPLWFVSRYRYLCSIGR